jgi:UDPglucose 6-dehydrogenase
MIIAGYGFVGKAHELLFKNFRREIVIHDPLKGKIADFDHTSAVIICVSTPELESGACDISAVCDVVSQCRETTPILIKSTIHLQGWQYLKKTFPNHRLCFSPEFLRAAHYMNDIHNLDNVILSGDTEYWRDQYSYNWPKLKIYTVTPEEAIAIKYFRNAFLATKVSFFNEIYDFCTTYGINFDQVQAGVTADKRIGESHSHVWPDDGVRGWGGMCFPKDTKALLKMAAEKNINLNTLSAAVYYNTKLKLDRDKKV